MRELVLHQERRRELGLLQFGSLVGAHQYLRLYRLLPRYVPQGSRVMDWGCGNGHFSYALLKLGYRAVGFSFGSFAFREVLQPLGYEFVQGNLAEPAALPFDAGSFDAVVSVGVLEHVRETGGGEAASLREIRRVLKPGGHLVGYHIPNRYSLINRVASLVPGKHYHRHRYTRASLTELCREAGMQAIEIRRYGFLPRNAWRHLPRRLRNAPKLARSWDILDGLLAVPFSAICQNYCFVARRVDLDSGPQGK
jgi:SAM-dependent methyltransferase